MANRTICNPATGEPVGELRRHTGRRARGPKGVGRHPTACPLRRHAGLRGPGGGELHVHRSAAHGRERQTVRADGR